MKVGCFIKPTFFASIFPTKPRSWDSQLLQIKWQEITDGHTSFKKSQRILLQKLQRGALWVEQGAMVQLLTMWEDDIHREELMARIILLVLPSLLLMQFECWTIWRRGLANRTFPWLLIAWHPSLLLVDRKTQWRSLAWKERLLFALIHYLLSLFSFPAQQAEQSLALQRQQRTMKFLPAPSARQQRQAFTQQTLHRSLQSGAESSPKVEQRAACLVWNSWNVKREMQLWQFVIWVFTAWVCVCVTHKLPQLVPASIWWGV